MVISQRPEHTTPWLRQSADALLHAVHQQFGFGIDPRHAPTTINSFPPDTRRPPAAMTIAKFARFLALIAGSLDFCTGLGLVFVPHQILPLMRVEVPQPNALVYLRFIGAFVGAVGASYLLALVRGGNDRLRSTLELTIVFRLFAGAFSATAISLGWLSFAWASVPAADFALVALQLWLVSKLTSCDGQATASENT